MPAANGGQSRRPGNGHPPPQEPPTPRDPVETVTVHHKEPPPPAPRRPCTWCEAPGRARPPTARARSDVAAQRAAEKAARAGEAGRPSGGEREEGFREDAVGGELGELVVVHAEQPREDLVVVLAHGRPHPVELQQRHRQPTAEAHHRPFTRRPGHGHEEVAADHVGIGQQLGRPERGAGGHARPLQQGGHLGGGARRRPLPDVAVELGQVGLPSGAVSEAGVVRPQRGHPNAPTKAFHSSSLPTAMATHWSSPTQR